MKAPVQGLGSDTGSVAGSGPHARWHQPLLLLLHQGRYVRWVCTARRRIAALMNKRVSSPIFKLLGVPCFWEVL